MQFELKICFFGTATCYSSIYCGTYKQQVLWATLSSTTCQTLRGIGCSTGYYYRRTSGNVFMLLTLFVDDYINFSSGRLSAPPSVGLFAFLTLFFIVCSADVVRRRPRFLYSVVTCWGQKRTSTTYSKPPSTAFDSCPTPLNRSRCIIEVKAPS